MSAYLALVILTHIDSVFFPGNELTIPGPVASRLPLVDAKGESGPQNRINILVMGLDRRPREGDTPTRTDTLFVVTVDPKTKTTGILGIPRDLWVDIPGKEGGTFQDRINTVYVWGETSKYPQGGVGLMKDVLKATPFGVKIDHYVIVDFKGFESVIDDLGGIDVDVPDEIYDPYYSESELPGDYDPQHFYPGVQHMNGSTALAYSRVRFSSDDLDRIQRQQRVIFAAIEKASSINALKNATSLWSKYKDTVKTDISDFQIPGYAALALQAKDKINAVSIGPATQPYTTREGAAVLLPDKAKIAEIVGSLFKDQPAGGTGSLDAQATPSPVRVQVQNGTGAEGLAGRVVRYIVGKGYPQEDLNATNVFDGDAHEQSLILDVDGTHSKNAFLIANWLKIPPAQVRVATASERAAMAGAPAADVVFILGADVNFDELIQSPTTSVPGG